MAAYQNMPLLRDLAAAVPGAVIEGDPLLPITAVAFDSRECQEGCLFFCIRGFNTDGHDYIPEAMAKGSAAMAVDRDVARPEGVTLVRCPDGRKAMALMGAAFYGRPADSLHLAGATGTNGKTSVTHYIAALLKEAGEMAGLIGTVETRVGDAVYPSHRTTPESLDLQALFRRMKDEGCVSAVMEVSSHAVDLERVCGVAFDAGIFTNFSQDHLDYHENLEKYFEAKKRFFVDGLAAKPGAVAIVNADDPRGADIAQSVFSKVLTYGIESGADVRASEPVFSRAGISMRVTGPGGARLEVESGLGGKFNAYNLLAAISYGLSRGFDPAFLEASVRKLKGAPGRFERIEEGQGFQTIVDYAHTPDGMENALRAAREICEGRLIVVFGAGGDRDRTKRPLMGAAAARLCDAAVVTSDNPRSEDPESIMDEIVRGLKAAAPQDFCLVMEPDRHRGISTALHMARPGDLVLIAGKGHETQQQFKDRTVHFDDREVCRKILRERFGH